jgi:hypothetical protein
MAPLLACCEISRPMLPDLTNAEVERAAAKDPSQIAAVVVTTLTDVGHRPQHLVVTNSHLADLKPLKRDQPPWCAR